jgi:hypothetical protein
MKKTSCIIIIALLFALASCQTNTPISPTESQETTMHKGSEKCVNTEHSELTTIKRLKIKRRAFPRQITPAIEKNSKLIFAAISIEEVISLEMSYREERSLVISGLEKAALVAAKLLYTVHVSEIIEVKVVGAEKRAAHSGIVIQVIDDINDVYTLTLSPYGGVDIAWKEGVVEPIFYIIQ